MLQITSLHEGRFTKLRQIMAIVNFSPRQMVNFMSECLVLGVYHSEGDVVLLQVSKTA